MQKSLYDKIMRTVTSHFILRCIGSKIVVVIVNADNHGNNSS